MDEKNYYNTHIYMKNNHTNPFPTLLISSELKS